MTTNPQVYSSWALRPGLPHYIEPVLDRFQIPRFQAGQLYLACGNGRSYGDSCLNAGHHLLPTRWLDRFMAFDAQQGILTCEAGVTLEAALRLIVPRGWFLPVVPGTQYVTVGGAVANDVHGKNHDSAGTFGCHVLELELLRSDGSALRCSPLSNTDLFNTTIGGLGLTGLIRWVTLRLKKITGSILTGQMIKFDSLQEFWQLSRDSESAYEYTVAWIDCLSTAGRGIFSRANHADLPAEGMSRASPVSIPSTLPTSLVNRLSVHTMNAYLYAKQMRKVVQKRWPLQQFFFPLDGVANWNRLYGPRGFFQYQCVLPMSTASDGLHQLLLAIRRAQQGSFLAVLKVFGAVASPGMLSFPRPGVTLALDFPNAGPRTVQLLATLEAVTRAAGGAIYPAKDATMSPQSFVCSFPRLQEFSRYVDPHFSSTFWRRVAV